MNENRILRMLIVDDEEGMRKTLRRIMLAKGFDVQVAADGYEAIQVAGDFQPDILLLDIRMPGLNGVETYREIKPLCPNAFAIFMTAYASSETSTQAMDEGAIDVIGKPLNVEALCNLIDRTAARRPILIVDDDEGFRSSLERALTALGFTVYTATGLDDAVQEFRIRPRSVAILDMKLDGDSGLDVLEQIRSLNQDAVTVLMTGFTELQPEMRDGMAAGASCTLVKPFNIDCLVSEIQARV